MADCLTLLRQYNTQKKEIVERDNLVIFDKVAWPKNAKTNYLLYRSGQAGGAKEYYTLESLLFLLKNVSLSHPMYVQRAGAQNIPVITLRDRRDLLGYLNGELETSSSIDKSVHLEMGIPAPAPKRLNEDTNNENAKKPRLDEDIQAEKERLVNFLKQTGRTKGAITDQIWSLGDAMSIEQIAAIKAKRLAKKRGTIKTDDIDGGGDRVYMDDTTKEIMSKERVHRSRVTVLQSSGKSFSNIFSLLQSVKARDEGKGGGGGGGGEKGNVVQPSKQNPKPTRTPGTHTHGYNRYEQEAYQGKADTGGFNIEMTRSFVGMNLKSVTESVSKPRPHPNPPKAAPVPRMPPPAAKPDPKPSRNDHKARTPIIIVPTAATSIINSFNAQDFLEGFKYVSLEEKKKGGSKQQNEVLIHRKRKHPTHPDQTLSIPYRIVSNPLRLPSREWKQVVAVFVAGPTWQFKGWPGLTSDGSPVDIFAQMKAYHLKFDELKCDPNILKWDVQVLEISRNKRHLDKASILRFWETLDRFIIKHKSELRY